MNRYLLIRLTKKLIFDSGNLTEDRDANLRRFSINATRNYSQPFDIYYWGNSQSNLVISVDWTTQGMKQNLNCNKKF